MAGNSHDFWVTVHGARGEEWVRVAGTNHFPVKSPIPVLGNLPGKPMSHIYLLALDQMEPEVLARIVAHLAQKFSMSEEEAKQEIDKAGIPILADDCGVMILNPRRWV